MRKKYRSIDIFEEEKKKPNILLPIVIFISVVTVLSVITTLIFSLVEKHTEIDLPWTENKEKKPNKPTTSSREQMDLMVPHIIQVDFKRDKVDTIIEITKVRKDKSGFWVQIELTAQKNQFSTITVKQAIVDGFYFDIYFELSDVYDNADIQSPTKYEFLLKKTELDELDMFGFNRLQLVYDLETDKGRDKNLELSTDFYNDIGIVNERKGLIQFDEKNKVTVSYYKTVAAYDATYIYFDFLNDNKEKDIKIYIKEITINNKLYDMSDFEEIAHRNCREAIYLKIPTKDIPRVNTIKLRFVFVEENNKGEKSFYITNEYTRAY